MKIITHYYLLLITLIPYFLYFIIFLDDPKPLLSCVIFITYSIFSGI